MYDVKRLQMRYAISLIGSVVFSLFFNNSFVNILLTFFPFWLSGPSTLATFVAVYTLFGPTFPGTYDKDRGTYTLFYPVCLMSSVSFIMLLFDVFAYMNDLLLGIVLCFSYP